jgi:hypothetical protein
MVNRYARYQETSGVTPALENQPPISMPLPNKPLRDKDIEAALGPTFAGLKHCVFCQLLSIAA